MVKHAVEPLSSLANQVELDISTRLETLTKLSLQQGAEIELTVRVRGCVLTDREKDDMQMMGITSFHDVKFFKVCKILGVHFRCGEWGCRRCGSVITTIYRGISRYCIVDTFFMVQDKMYARVTWLSTPTYPCRPFKIVVMVTLMTPAAQLLHRSVIPVDKIDPCSVAVLPHSDGVHFFMLREKGTDRVQWPT